MSSGSHPREFQEELCGLAIKVAEIFDTRLDYSVESIRQVEPILGEIHNNYLATRSEEGLDGVAMEFASYIVTVIQRHFGPAQWERDCPTFGEKAYPLHRPRGMIYPYSWCQKRIFDGPADDVWLKFQTLVVKEPPAHRPWWKFW